MTCTTGEFDVCFDDGSEVNVNDFPSPKLYFADVFGFCGGHSYFKCAGFGVSMNENFCKINTPMDGDVMILFGLDNVVPTTVNISVIINDVNKEYF